VSKAVLITFAAVVAVALVAVCLVVAWPRRNLDRFLTQITTVKIGVTKLEDWRGQVEGAHLLNVNVKCDQRTCGIGWTGENKLLQRLRLAPRTVVTAGVGFKDGVADEIYILLSILKRNDQGDWLDDKGVVVRQSSDAPLPCDHRYKLEVKQRYGVGDRNWATVAMDSCVSPEDRAKAIAINTGCLTKLGGCKTVEEMAPQVFGRP
jgi:hypothetical protein